MCALVLSATSVGRKACQTVGELCSHAIFRSAAAAVRIPLNTERHQRTASALSTDWHAVAAPVGCESTTEFSCRPYRSTTHSLLLRPCTPFSATRPPSVHHKQTRRARLDWPNRTRLPTHPSTAGTNTAAPNRPTERRCTHAAAIVARHTPCIHPISTRQPPDIHPTYTLHTPDIHPTYTRHTPDNCSQGRI